MLKDLYIKKFGVAPESVTQLTQAGSNRRYFRLRGVETVVGVAGTSVEENEAFIYLSRHFYSRGLNVPRVIAVSADGLCYLQTDLGDMSLFDRRTDTTLLEKAVSALPDFQYSGAVGLDFSRCYPVSDFDAQSILWDLNYFKLLPEHDRDALSRSESRSRFPQDGCHALGEPRGDFHVSRFSVAQRDDCRQRTVFY